ncbi:MAG: hypothetical protein ACTHLU_08370 [Novosphingobium sp.]
MRKLTILAVPAALAAVPALAQTSDVTGTVVVSGSVAPRCQFVAPTSVNLPLGELAQSGNGELDTTKVDNQSRTLNGWCNGASARIWVEAQPLTNTASAGTSGSFTNVVDYTATATAGSAAPNDTSASPGAGSPVGLGLFSGDINVVLTASTAGGKKLVAGSYNGNVIVTLSPNFTPD